MSSRNDANYAIEKRVLYERSIVPVIALVVCVLDQVALENVIVASADSLIHCGLTACRLVPTAQDGIVWSIVNVIVDVPAKSILSNIRLRLTVIGGNNK